MELLVSAFHLDIEQHRRKFSKAKDTLLPPYYFILNQKDLSQSYIKRTLITFLNLHKQGIMREIMITPKDVDHIKFMKAVAEELKKNENVKPHALAGGKFIRMMLQQLEKAGYLQKIQKPVHGRALTPLGQKFLDGVAKSCK